MLYSNMCFIIISLIFIPSSFGLLPDYVFIDIICSHSSTRMTVSKMIHLFDVNYSSLCWFVWMAFSKHNWCETSGSDMVRMNIVNTFENDMHQNYIPQDNEISIVLKVDVKDDIAVLLQWSYVSFELLNWLRKDTEIQKLYEKQFHILKCYRTLLMG